MESSTKNKKNNDDIMKMVRKAFGNEMNTQLVTSKELTEGFYNVAYEVVLPEKSVILKIAPPTDSLIMIYEQNIMRAEVDALRLVKEKTSVPVPQVLYYDNSHSICDSDYFFMEKIEGESFFKLRYSGMSEEEQKKITFEIGRVNAIMNQVEGKVFGLLGLEQKQRCSWKEAFLIMMEDVLKDGETIEIGLGVEYDEVRNLIRRASYALEEVTKPVFIHWDLWDGNAFIKDGKITGIIDFERALWGDPLMESYFRAHCNTKEFNDGYGADLRKESPVRALLYDMYLYLIMVIETKFRMYPDDWQLNFATKELHKAMKELKQLI